MNTAVAMSHEPPLGRYQRRLLFAGCVVAALLPASAAAFFAASEAATHPELVGLARGLIVGVPIAIGLGAWYREPAERFGLVLAAIGASWSFTTLAESHDELLYSIGRIAGWLGEVLIVYLVLSFPTGRLTDRVDRILVGAMGGVVLVLFAPRIVLAEDFPVPAPFTSCTANCPENAFFLLEREPAFVDAVLRPAGALLAIAVAVGVLLRLRERILSETPLGRRLYWPVLGVAAARVALFAAAFAVRDAGAEVWAVDAAAWALALSLPAIALATVFGSLRWRLFAHDALTRLVRSMRGAPNGAMLRRAFADALGDPTLQIAIPKSGAPGEWTDASGRAIAPPQAGGGRAVSEVRDRGTVVAALVHDEALRMDRELVDAGVALVGVVLENRRLAEQASSATRDVQRSRARLAVSAERERRRIERDLHDGAQQRLVALRIELELAEEVVKRDPEQGVQRLKELERELDDTLEELRSLAHGVYPPVLADRGLGDALEGLALRSPIPVELELHGVERYPTEVESAIYFCVLEALQNVSKHATGARRVTVRVDGSDGAELRFSVRDDGAGATAGAIVPGVGITNMRDRLSTLGGSITMTSTPSVGTTVRGLVPKPAQPLV